MEDNTQKREAAENDLATSINKETDDRKKADDDRNKSENDVVRNCIFCFASLHFFHHKIIPNYQTISLNKTSDP